MFLKCQEGLSKKRTTKNERHEVGIQCTFSHQIYLETQLGTQSTRLLFTMPFVTQRSSSRGTFGPLEKHKTLKYCHEKYQPCLNDCQLCLSCTCKFWIPEIVKFISIATFCEMADFQKFKTCISIDENQYGSRL